MASSMTTVGVVPEFAYAIAEEVEEQLIDGDADSVTVEELLSLAGATLTS